MATISEKIAREIADNDGVYPGDPHCFAVFKYWNHTFHKHDFAVAYDFQDFVRYLDLKIVEFLWCKEPSVSRAVLKAQEEIDSAENARNKKD